VWWNIKSYRILYTGYSLYSSVSPSPPRPCVTVCHHISTGVYHHAPLRTLQHALTNGTEHYSLPSQTLHVFAPSHRLHVAWCSLLSLFRARSQFHSPGGLSTAILYGSPSAPRDITYCATWWNLNRNWAAYGYRKQRCVRGYCATRLAISRPMGESHTEERESHFLNLFHTSFLADLHNGTFAAAVSISLTYSQMGEATSKRSLVLLISSYSCFRQFPFSSIPKCSVHILSKG